MNQLCKLTGKYFEIGADDLAFYKQLGVDVPTICPEERQRQRVSFRNFRHLYTRDCPATGKKIISMYHNKQPFPVYENSYWWSDNWSAFDYGREIEFSKSFFEQYTRLSKTVPRFATTCINCENSDYCNFALESKDCYLVFGCVRNDNCYYGHIVWDCENCIDGLYVFKSKWCSHCIDCVECYDVHYSSEVIRCSESYFLHDCQNCHNCFGSYNLRNKRYCLFNEQLTKTEYENAVKKYLPLTQETLDAMEEYMGNMREQKAFYPEYFGLMNEEVSGNHIYNSRNLTEAFDAKSCEDAKYLYTAFSVENSQDISFTGATTKFCFQCLNVGHVENVICSHTVFSSHDVAYSEFCFGSNNLLGCNGLRNASYCIFNKQYSKEDYFNLREKIVARMQEKNLWGEFFPPQLSPFAYSESIAQEYMPLDETEREKLNYNVWEIDEKGSAAQGKNPREFFAATSMTDAQICSTVFACEVSGKPYRITQAELNFAKKLSLPLPLICPEQRHLKRMSLRSPRKLQKLSCANCAEEITTAHTKRALCTTCYRNCCNNY